MIKILFFIPSLIGGGAEKVLCNLVNHMDFHQFDITVVTYEPSDKTKYLVPEIHYKAINKMRTTCGKKWFSYFYRLMAEWKLAYPIWLKGPYDIECAYLETEATKIIAGSTNQKAIKLAWVHCDLETRVQFPETFVQKTQKYYQKYDNVVCVAESVRNGFEKLYGYHPKAITLYNTVDEDDIIRKSKAPLTITKERTTLVLAGRLTYQKNIGRLLKAHRKLIDDGVDVDVWILGDGELHSSIEEEIQRHGLQQRATLWGFQENPYPFMLAADLLVCSSTYEGYSTFIMEGLILGKPVVTTDVSGMRELLGDSTYGLITANDDQAFYHGLKQILTDAELLNHYRKMAIERGKEFKMKQTIMQTQRFFHALISERQGK